jgi:hypothetical protein
MHNYRKTLVHSCSNSFNEIQFRQIFSFSVLQSGRSSWRPLDRRVRFCETTLPSEHHLGESTFMSCDTAYTTSHAILRLYHWRIPRPSWDDIICKRIETLHCGMSPQVLSLRDYPLGFDFLIILGHDDTKC